jgi:membrane protein implicated in regulation of membrane protease activity
MLKPVILTCVAFLVAGIVGVCGLYLTDDVAVAAGGFIAAMILQVVVIWNWHDRDADRPPG